MLDLQIASEEICQFIPQRNPFVMIDNFIKWEDRHATTQLTVSSDNIFVENGFLLAPALIENIAQTIAIRVGYWFYLERKPAPMGYLGAVKKFKVHRLPKIGETITTSIDVLHDLFNVTMVTGKIECNGELIASSEMKTVLAK